MKKVGIIGWRGMVGSVLVDRMRAERDFDLIEPVFFSTTQAGGSGPQIGKATRASRTTRAILEALAAMDILISCQGGDYTSRDLPEAARCRLERLLDRRGQDAAYERRCGDRPRSR